MKSINLSMIMLLTITAVTNSMAQRVLGELGGVRVTATQVQSRKPGETVYIVGELSKESFKVYIKSDSDSKVETYGGDMKLISSESVELGTSNSEYRKSANYWRNLHLNGKRYSLSINIDKGENTFAAIEIGDDGMNKSEPEEFLRLPSENAFDDFKTFVFSRPGLLMSENGAYALLSMRLPEPDDSDPVVFTHQYVMFGADMNVLWSRKIKYDHSEGIQKLESEVAMNDGSMVSLTRVDRGRSADSDDRFEQRLYHVNADEVQKKGFPATGKVLLAYSDIKSDGVVAVCTYGLRSYEGLLVVDWNFDGELNVKKVPYGIEHLTKKVSEKQTANLKKAHEKGKPLTIEKLEIQGVKKLSDGKLLAYGQERWSGSDNDFIAGTIHFFCLDKNHDMLWSQVIPVRQTHSGTDEGLGYIFQVTGDNAYVVFNDNYRNLKWDESSSDPSQYSGPDNPVVLVSFSISNPEQSYLRQKLWDSKDVGGSLTIPKYYHHQDDNFGIVYIQGGHLKECLVKIDFDAEK